MKTKLPRFILTICAVVIGAHVYGQISTQRLVKDICTVENSLSNDFRQITSDGKGIFFVAEHDTFGVELWYSDGTKEGTNILRDIAPGLASSSPSIIEFKDSILYFFTVDSSKGISFWKSDGTHTGTVPLTNRTRDQLVLPLESYDIHVFDNSVFYRLRGLTWDTPINRYDLASRKIETLRIGDTNSRPSTTVKIKDGIIVTTILNKTHRFHFVHKDSNNSILLPFPDSIKISNIYSFVVIADKLYFTGPDSQTRKQSLYRYDLTNQICHRFSTLSSDDDYLKFTLDYVKTENGIIFIAEQNAREEVWMAENKSDTLRRICNIGTLKYRGIENILYQNNHIYFTTGQEFPKDQHLIWRVNTSNLLLDTFNLNLNDVTFISSRPFFIGENMIFFSGHKYSIGVELFQHNMTTHQTKIVIDLAVGPRSSVLTPVFKVGQKLFTNSYDGILGNELGVININNPDSFTWLTRTLQISGSSNPYFLTLTNDKLHFVANDITSGYRLLETDVTSERTRIINVPSPPGYGYTFGNIAPVEKHLYFTFYNEKNNTEIARLNPKGILDRIELPSNFASIRYVKPYKDVLFIEVFNTETKLENLYLISNKSKELILISQSAYRYNLHEAATLGSKMYYSLRNVLYEFDVTTLQNERSSIVSLNTEVYTPIRTDGHNLYFTAYDKTKLFGIELWQSDGTRENTKMIVDHTPGSASTFLTDLTIFNRNVAFSTLSLDGITEVWAYIHNIKTVVLIKTHGPFTPIKIHSPSTESDCLFLTLTNIFGGQNLWCYNAKTSKLELFHSTTKQKDVVGLYPYYLDGWCYYLNTTSDDASTLYKTDGTIQGTSIVKRWEPSDNINMPTNLVLADRKLFYSAYSTEYGRELFVMDLPNHQVTAKNPLKLLPNPVTDHAKLLVHGRTANEAADIRVFNVSGQLVQQITANTNPIELNFEYLTPGVYIIRLANGMSTKFIKL